VPSGYRIDNAGGEGVITAECRECMCEYAVVVVVVVVVVVEVVVAKVVNIR